MGWGVNSETGGLSSGEKQGMSTHCGDLNEVDNNPLSFCNSQAVYITQPSQGPYQHLK